ncbi:YitT family protein [Clostridium sp. P21]|uniref:YitT family protein n=1 Tax=Clostridium muellerianum TaxID=2716538 RepID=A0A7Y0HNE2_9CLOT|nr:YitT family protein [Clostridium muellerianum]NMM61921.1 YitT family protein [Clostridium muellerianum]
MSGGFLKKENIIDILFTIVGGILCSVAVNMFLVKAKLLGGGVTGLALIFQYLLKVPAGYMIFLLNVPLFIISMKSMNRKFTIYSLVGIVTFSLSLILTRPISNILQINDELLYCLYGGVINGIGGGIVFAHNSSLGGFDIICILIKKKYSNLDLGKISFGINLVIVCFGAMVFGLPSALYTLIAMYTTTSVIDYVIKGLNRTKTIFIITEKEEEISGVILKKLGRGVTYLYGEGAYTKDHKKILYCIVPSPQLPELKRIVIDIDNKAFISILDASEIHGRGFTKTL